MLYRILKKHFFKLLSLCLSLPTQVTEHNIRNLHVKQNTADYAMILITLTSKIVFFTSLRIWRFFSNVASISSRLLTTSGPRTPWKHGSGRFSPSYILAKWICPSHTCKWKFTKFKSAKSWKQYLHGHCLFD